MWKNINFESNIINIDHSWNYEENRAQTTKANSDRIVHINQNTINLLLNLKEHSSSDFVFMNQYNKWSMATIYSKGSTNVKSFS